MAPTGTLVPVPTVAGSPTDPATPLPRLPPAARRQIAGVAVSSFGTGLTLPYTLVLLSEVRGLPLGTTGLLLAVPGVVGLAAVPLSGVLVDRAGAARVLRACMVLQAVADLLLARAHTPGQALPAMALLGLGLGPSFPAASALLSGLLGERADPARAFGMQFTLLNAAIGVGGLVGALVVDVHRPATFVALYVANAVACLVYAAIVPPAPRRTPPPSGAAAQAPPSYREVLADPVFRRVCLVSLLLALTGYSALDAGLPAYSRVVGGVPAAALGLVFAANTAVIVAGQLAVLKRIRDWRRTRALATAGGLWALSWAVLLALPALHGTAAVALVLTFGALFGVGEIFLAPALQPLVNALATDRLRGRYNALSQSTFSLAFVVSPAIAAGLVASGLGLLWVAMLVAGSAAVVVVTLRLAQRLTPAQDGVPVGSLDLPAASVVTTPGLA